MEKQNRTDLRINGLGSASGGSYNFVQINGKGDITGDIDCVDLQINGLGCIQGNVKANIARVAGKSEIKGSLTGQTITVDGMIEISGVLSAERIENRGALRVDKDCGCEVFNSKGGFAIGGLLNSGKIDVEIYASCKAREIGGERISIRMGDAFGLRRFLDSIFPGLGLSRELSTETIEGDEIYLEYTKAKFVRGENVHLGPGCLIQSVEYKSTFRKDTDALVKETKKI